MKPAAYLICVQWGLNLVSVMENGILERQFGVYVTSFVSSIHKLEDLIYLAGTNH